MRYGWRYWRRYRRCNGGDRSDRGLGEAHGSVTGGGCVVLTTEDVVSVECAVGAVGVCAKVVTPTRGIARD